MKPLDHNAALDLRFDSDAGEDKTIRFYFLRLLTTLWDEGEGFSGKRPFGNSGWEHDLYQPLVKAGYVKGKLDPQGYIESFDEKQANSVVKELMVFALYGHAKP